MRARALADRAVLAIWVGDANSRSQAQQALAIAREVDDPALLPRALTALRPYRRRSLIAELARPYFAEAIGLARALDDRWRLSQILAWQAWGETGDPIAARAPADEGRDLAEAIGDRYDSRQCRWFLGMAQLMQGDLAGAAAQFAELVAEARAAHDRLLEVNSLASLGLVLAYQGDAGAARAAADAAVEAAAELGVLCRHRLRGVSCRGLCRRGCCDGTGRVRGLAAAECPPPDGGSVGRVQYGGRLGAQGSGRGPELGPTRRSRW